MGGGIVLSSLEETHRFGEALACCLKPNAILALSGDLGSGKTSFVQGVAKGLGIFSPIQSPTFIYLNVYEEGKVPFYHFDLYRLKNESDFWNMGFEEYFEKGGITAIEWPEKLGETLPKHCLFLQFSHAEKGRIIHFPSSFDSEMLDFLKKWH
ncbi:MAG: tRNA (adenosine(37)-N6)-threonylcarbamoyltransferase complex ATPase subunit type 1 TsaE [Chlamydiae bacterium]|nr:tRNA (adenosine(37)-N6)-threonylcarbamoyltransferase complex ATPase subunit type 1 TsaE [Chlamydiota bacterium]